MTLLCVAADCEPYPGETGPKESQDGLSTCRACTRNLWHQLADLPVLYVDLLIPTRAGGSGGRIASPADADDDGRGWDGAQVSRPAPVGLECIAARAEIKVALVGWAVILEEEFGTRLPADDVASLCRHLRAHSRRLLASEHAARLCDEIDERHTVAFRRAYPAPPQGQALGACPDCGTIVRAADMHSEATCRGCGTVRPVEDWRALIVGDLGTEAAADAKALIAWLTARHRRQVTHTALRLWVSKGVKVGGETVRLTRIGTDARGRGTYSVADASRIAASLYGTRVDA
jgi:RNA polymerase subunit RPABC4/transcription elongation factor Spt4